MFCLKNNSCCGDGEGEVRISSAVRVKVIAEETRRKDNKGEGGGEVGGAEETVR